MTRYHVALWRSWSHTSWAGYPWLPVATGDVEAASPLSAVLILMSVSRVRCVPHAEAHVAGTNVIARYERVNLDTDAQAAAEEVAEEVGNG